MEKVPGNLLLHVKRIAGDIGPRSFRDLENLNRASEYIEDVFRSTGCKVRRQGFSFDGRTYHNIECIVEGTGEGLIVVGAHYDTVEGSPGADDNTSGVAGLLELARLASINKPRVTVRFVAFSLEEPPVFGSSRMGSAVYAKSLHDSGINADGMMSLEMIGYYCNRKGCQFYPFPVFKLRYPKTGDFIAFVGNISSKKFTRSMKQAFKKHTDLPVESLNTVGVVPGVDFSDHRSFWRHDVQAFMVTDTAFYRNPNYHRPGDTPDTLDYERMAKVVTGLSGAIATY